MATAACIIALSTAAVWVIAALLVRVFAHRLAPAAAAGQARAAARPPQESLRRWSGLALLSGVLLGFAMWLGCALGAQL